MSILKTKIIGSICNRKTLNEGSSLDYYPYDGGEDWELLLSFSEPTPREIEAATNQPLEIGLNIIDTIPFFCFKIGTAIPWQECPFNPALVGVKDFWLERSRSTQSIELIFSGVNTNNRKYFASRLIRLDKRFSQMFLKACFDFKSSGDFTQRLERIYGKYVLTEIGSRSQHRHFVS